MTWPELPTSAREALEARGRVLATLGGGSALRGGGGALAGDLAARWSDERQLIERVLADTDAEGSVFGTLDRWAERTRAYQQRAGLDAAWTDREGRAWRADRVMEVLGDLQDRLRAWRSLEEQASAAEGGAEATVTASAPPSAQGGPAAGRNA